MNPNELKQHLSHCTINKQYPNKDAYILLSNKYCLAHLTIVFHKNDSKYKSLVFRIDGKSTFIVNLNLLQNHRV